MSPLSLQTTQPEYEGKDEKHSPRKTSVDALIDVADVRVEGCTLGMELRPERLLK
jgi:hypothetical protein